MMRDYDKNSFIRERQDCEFQEFRPSLSKPIIDEIDRVPEGTTSSQKTVGFHPFARLRGGNYDIKYRIRRDTENEEK